MNGAWKTFGHEKIKRLLESHLSSGQFPHAYLFFGPEGLGKKNLALEFAQKALLADRLSNHPDFQILEEAGQISVERVRDFISSLGYKPFFGRKKIAIVNDAQNLNLQSANALLKTLEEPSDSTILILIASGKKLLPTIISRCQVFEFNAFSPKQLLEFASAQGMSVSAETAVLSFGSLARMLRLSQDSEFNRQEAGLAEKWQDLRKCSRAERLLAVKEFGEREQGDLRQILQSWYFLQAEKLREQPAEYPAVRALAEALEQLQTNKNRKLILQGLFMKLEGHG